MVELGREFGRERRVEKFIRPRLGAAVFLTVLWWDEHRLLAIGLATAALIAAGLFCASRASSELKRSGRLFSASLSELSQDREMLGRDE